MSERTGYQKAAILTITLGPKSASAIYGHLNEEEIERVTAEIARLGTITADEKREVLDEFLQMMMAQKYISQGGLDLAQEILDKAVGKHKATAILNRMHGFGANTSFELLQKIEPATIANFLKNEHPQTVAVVLAHMDSRLTGPVLAKLPEEMQPEISYRIATMDRPSPDVLKVVEEVLNSYLSSDFNAMSEQAGGTKKVAEALNEIDREVWREILEGLEEFSKEVAYDVKNQMFIFEDIVTLDDKSIQELLKNVDTKELSMGLKAATDDVKDKIFNNMSKRAVSGIQEDMEYMGPVRVTDVEASQQRIVDVIRKLEEDGTIILGKAGGGAVMVE